MTKMLVVDHLKCTGCRLCEVVCSVNKNGVSNPARARIAVIGWENICPGIPMMCQQCEMAPCISVCPVGALTRDESMGRVSLNYDLCIGCKLCVAVCPFGAMGIDAAARRVIKCDLCDGDPMCVKFCETKALQFLDESQAKTAKMRLATTGLSELIRKFAIQ